MHEGMQRCGKSADNFGKISVGSAQLLQSQQGGPQGAAQVGLPGQENGCAQLLLQCPNYPQVSGHPTGHHVGGMSPCPLDHGGGAGGDGFAQAVDDVTGGVVVGDEGNDLRLGKNGAHAGDGKIHIGDNDLLKVHLLDMAVKTDSESGRCKPIKLAPTAHIDGGVALLDAMTVRQKYYAEIGEQLKNG